MPILTSAGPALIDAVLDLAAGLAVITDPAQPVTVVDGPVLTMSGTDLFIVGDDDQGESPVIESTQVGVSAGASRRRETLTLHCRILIRRGGIGGQKTARDRAYEVLAGFETALRIVVGGPAPGATLGGLVRYCGITRITYAGTPADEATAGRVADVAFDITAETDLTNQETRT